MERTYTTPLLDKLGVRAGARVALVRIADPAFRARLAERTDAVTEGLPREATDLVFFGADRVDELLELAAVEPHLQPNGAVWVVSRKGRAATLRDVDVIDAARSVGLVDNKVVAFSETHTALRLVIPLARRSGR